ncbi:MAG: hypothetical protein J6S29_06635, partial [Methanosphaera sp.]|nr:hypothetical protein [Methanosphaera sp.]
EGESIYINDANYTIENSYFDDAIYTSFDCEIAELNNNTFVNEHNTIDNREYYYVYQGKGSQIEYDPYIIGEGNLTAEYFNLVDYGLVSPVKNQGFNGACWAFSNNGALESAILKATNKKVLFDISENNVQNLGLRYSPLGNLELLEGATLSTASSYMLSWIGVTTVEDDVYDEFGKISPIIDNGSKYYVYDYIILPAYNKISDISLYKEALIKYGALAVYVFGAGGSDSEDYNEKTASSYSPENVDPDHGVTLVGWNDTFSRYNFKITPPGDGAWIIKNSWGTDWGDNGYYYVSYYDKAFSYDENPIAYILNNSYSFEKNYEYNAISRPVFNELTENTTGYVNIYNATEDDLIAAVGTYFGNIDVEYAIEIESHDLIFGQEGKSTYAGYETIVLDHFVPIYKDEQFKVEIRITDLPLNSASRQHIPQNSSYANTTTGYVDLVKLDAQACMKIYTVQDNSYMEYSNLTTEYGSGEYIKVRYYDENGELLINSPVEFKINDQSIQTSTDEEAIAVLNVTLPVGTYIVTAINPINQDEHNITLTILSDDTSGDSKTVKPEYNNYKHAGLTLGQSSYNNYAGLHKIIVNDTVVYESNVLTLDALNKIFGEDFRNGHLLVYIDGKLVFNDTVGDDLTRVILEIIERFLGNHELKVEFTDSNNKTNTYVENVTIV